MSLHSSSPPLATGPLINRIAPTLATAAAGLALATALAGCADDACDNTPGVICTYAGIGVEAFDGDGNTLKESAFYWPVELTFAESGTYFVDWNNHRVRKLTAEGTLETVIGTDFVGDGPEDRSDLMPPGAPGTEVVLNHPTQLLELPSGKMLLTSWHNHKLREYDPETGLVHIICGSGPGHAGDNGPARQAQLDQPQWVALAPDGSLYILDQRNQVIRKIDTEGIMHTVAGTVDVAGFAGDGGSPLEAQFNFPSGSNPPPNGGAVVDADGRLYVADTFNHRIRVIDFAANTINTLVGTGEPGFSGDGGPAAEAQINNPRKLTLGPDGRLYFGDTFNHRIRAVDLETGIITTVAGNGEAGFAGDGEAPEDASLNGPVGVSFSPEGDMYIIDSLNNRIRRVLRAAN